MKAVAYNIKDYEKESLAIANGKVHDLTLISNPLSWSTLHYAQGKEVLIVSEDDVLDDRLLDGIQQVGIQKIVTRSLHTAHIDLYHAYRLGIQVANTPYADNTAKGIAEQTIGNLNLWGAGKCVGTACCCVKTCHVMDVNRTENEINE